MLKCCLKNQMGHQWLWKVCRELSFEQVWKMSLQFHSRASPASKISLHSRGSTGNFWNHDVSQWRKDSRFIWAIRSWKELVSLGHSTQGVSAPRWTPAELSCEHDASVADVSQGSAASSNHLWWAPTHSLAEQTPGLTFSNFYYTSKK